MQQMIAIGADECMETLRFSLECVGPRLKTAGPLLLRRQRIEFCWCRWPALGPS